VIVHICNDVGGWDKGFVLALSKRWDEPERAYRVAFSGGGNLALGDVQFVRVSATLTVANLIGQRGLAPDSTGEPPIRYEAVRAGLEKIGAYAKEHRLGVHMPRIGCGLAGGKWELIEPIINETLVTKGLSVTVYDL
jgi:O-acetyl-ADP-ribose deacetylase (regulator of RNase III)